jgi:hypothetical protein
MSKASARPRSTCTSGQQIYCDGFAGGLMGASRPAKNPASPSAEVQWAHAVELLLRRDLSAGSRRIYKLTLDRVQRQLDGRRRAGRDHTGSAGQSGGGCVSGCLAGTSACDHCSPMRARVSRPLPSLPPTMTRLADVADSTLVRGTFVAPDGTASYV